MADLNGAAQATPLTLWRMICASMTHSWRVSASVALGVATATAVIVGALLVGDSMRGSLRGLTIERLGTTENAIFPMGFFQIDGLTSSPIAPVPLILFQDGTVEVRGENGSIRRAGSVQIIGCDDDFWRLDATGLGKMPPLGEDGVILNESTATELSVDVGDLITLRLPAEQAVPADSPLGRRDLQSEGLPRMRVLEIIPDRGLGIFSLLPSQAAPKNVFVSRRTVAETLEREGQANALLFDQPVTAGDLNVRLEDIGLQLRRITRRFNPVEGDPRTIYDYYWLTSDRLLLPEVVVDRLRTTIPKDQLLETSTYLANAIERLDESGKVIASVPYSTITALDPSPSLPLNYETNEADPEGGVNGLVPLVINQWAADRLDAIPGTRLRVAYYEPEVKNGNEIERFFDAVVTDVVPITQPATPYRRRREATFDVPPTVYNDPDLTPTVPGVTDQDSINDWDMPFPLKREISKADDLYWNDYRLTPKAFLPLKMGQQIFGSRFGKTTGLRITPDTAENLEQLRARLASDIEPVLGDLGWSVRPIRNQQLSASRGTTPFDGLFLSLSFFVILAAVMLIAMLFRLGLTQRMRQFGTLLALGWGPRRVGSFVLGEGLLVAALGALAGMLGGVVYAWGVLWALKSWWLGAVTVPFLNFHWTTRSLLIGSLVGWLVAAITLVVTTRWLTRADAQSLLAERDMDTTIDRNHSNRKLPFAAGAVGLLSLGIAAFGATTGGQIAAGAFVGGGMLLLVAALIFIFARLRQPRRFLDQTQMRSFSLFGFASRNASRHPLRSTMTIGLMATAAFLIIAISAFRLQPGRQGTGGFSLVGQSSLPLFRDLRDPLVRSELLGPDAEKLEDAIIMPMRLRVGQDASCNNLYQATRPTVLGIQESFAELFGKAANSLTGFEWAATGEIGSGKSPWDALARTATGTEENPIPVILDQNTAMWSLQMMKGVGEVRSFAYEPDKPVYFQVVGLLANSMLQGKLLIGEANFETLFPNVSGYRYFLIADKKGQSQTVASIMENRLGDVGMDVTDANVLLSGMLAVQNTYLRTFQSLGLLGLLLGTIGLAVAQLRSVLERRQELAVMQAVGFTNRRLAAVVMSETAMLLFLGIGCGGVCAVLAVLPHAILNGIDPPLIEPLLVVLSIIAFGLLAGLLAVQRVSRIPLLESLRSE